MTVLEQSLLVFAYHGVLLSREDPSADPGCVVINYRGDERTRKSTREAVESLLGSNHLRVIPAKEVPSAWRSEPAAKARYFVLTPTGMVLASKLAEDFDAIAA